MKNAMKLYRNLPLEIKNNLKELDIIDAIKLYGGTDLTDDDDHFSTDRIGDYLVEKVRTSSNKEKTLKEYENMKEYEILEGFRKNDR